RRAMTWPFAARWRPPASTSSRGTVGDQGSVCASPRGAKSVRNESSLRPVHQPCHVAKVPQRTAFEPYASHAFRRIPSAPRGLRSSFPSSFCGHGQARKLSSKVSNGSKPQDSLKRRRIGELAARLG